MKKSDLILLLFVGVGIVGFFIVSNQFQTQNNNSGQTAVPKQSSLPMQKLHAVNYRAAFAIYTNGTKRIFTDQKYHNQSPDVFITRDTPALLTVKQSGITWQDFFATLPMTVTDTCLTTGTGQVFCDGQNGELQFFLNGNLTFGALSRTIQDEDQLLVTFGSETQEQINQQMQEIATP